MAEPASVSVALTTFNGARHLARQLDSLVAQDRRPDEIVVCDDGSTDDTVTVLERYAATCPVPIRIHRNAERLGYRANFIKTASLCRSELICFCDQDDYWEPAKIGLMTAQFGDPAILLAYHNAGVVDAEERSLRPMLDDAEERAILAQRPMPPWHYSLGFTQTMRRALTEYNDLWPISLDHDRDAPMAHDQWFFFLALMLGRVAYADDRLVRYRQHAANTYGAGKKGSPLRRFAARLGHIKGWDERAAHAAEARAAIARKIAGRVSPAQASRLDEIAALYSAFAARLQRRHAVYSAVSRWARLSALEASVRRGDYRGAGPWKFDWRALPRDLLIAMVSGHSAI